MKRYSNKHPICVCGLFPKPEQARLARSVLRARGVSDDQMVVYDEPEELFTPGAPPTINEPVRGLAVGTILGAALGTTLGIVLAGPLGFTALGGLTGAAFGAASGGLFGGLGGFIVGNDLPADKLKEMACALEDGKTMLVAVVLNKQREASVREVMRHRGSEQVMTVS